jgi:hypothetical protein
VLGGQGPSLGHDPNYQAMAGCLGKVFVAEIRAAGAGDPSGASLVGFGILTPTAVNAPATEVACVLTSTQRQAQTAATRMVHRTGVNTILPAEGESFQTLFNARSVTTLTLQGRHLTRLELSDLPDSQAGFVFAANASGELPVLLGGSAPRQYAPLMP